jgi:hypothetical protein
VRVGSGERGAGSGELGTGNIANGAAHEPGAGSKLAKLERSSTIDINSPLLAPRSSLYFTHPLPVPIDLAYRAGRSGSSPDRGYK